MMMLIGPVPRTALDGKRHPWRQVMDGLSYVTRNRLVLGAISLDLFAVLLGGATAMLPIYARDILHVGSAGLGHLRAAPAVGSALIAIWFSRHPLTTNVGFKLLVAVAVFGVATIMFGLSQLTPFPLIVALACLALLGAADMIIGRTPHIRINRLFGDSHQVWVKSERSNPGGSIKDRIALAMVEDAERSGKLKPGGTIIEPTSGNTGIGLAMVAAVKGYKLVLVMPDSMSIERRRLMLAYGASFDLTPREKGMKGAIARAQELRRRRRARGSRSSSRTRPTWKCTSAPRRARSWRTFPDGLDYLITGVGTGGHITACAKVLKKQWPKLKVFAVEPVASPVLSGGQPRRTRSRA
jgi:cysteine synthase